MSLPTNPSYRKDTPIYTGVMLYFPDALAEVARVSKAGNDQHHPGEPLHWDKEKSTDEGDALIRHQLEAGTFDTDLQRHSAKVAWRALAQLQRELEAAEETEIVTTMAYGQVEVTPPVTHSTGELDRVVHEKTNDYLAKNCAICQANEREERANSRG